MINNLNKILQDPRIIPRQIKYIAGFNLNALLNISLIDIRHIEKYLKYNNIKEKLVELYQTRQWQIVLWTHMDNCIQEIIEKLIEYLQLPIIYFISTNDDIFKLPNYGTWKLLSNSFLNLDKNISFYVGDNYGLLETIHNTKKGFSDIDSSDIKFARNLEILFYSPKEYFKNIPKSKDYLLDTYGIDIFKKHTTFGAYQKHPPYIPKKPEFIICIGPPSSGKTHYINRHYNLIYYHHIEAKYFENNYIKKMIQSNLGKGKSVILEGTYETPEKRSEAIEYLGRFRPITKCLNLNIGIDLCRHLNNYHMKKTNNPKVPSKIFKEYQRTIHYPYFHEGFDEVLDIAFDPHFNNMSDYILFFEYS
jgi:DNA 3'-phosphatase